MPERTRVGIDLVHVEEVSRSLERFGRRYVNRLFTPAEAAYCDAEPRTAAERFAVRFAAKEAVFKALRAADEAIDWRSVEVRRSPGGWCDIVLHGPMAALAERSGVTELSLSMSHEAAYATAVVVASGNFANEGAAQ
ncbi:MAG: 4'-phosphopantetheinyl transferase superfamily protein [Gemmatimonadota bacterium]